ncbi:MAG: RnfABCDGE type electron transport complex subunit G [Verrucomicrobiota bacterium]|jgi:electron transport complex protein RnfG|nr:RnfABCDGE type electron transport complex subunit G [Verrucomicrobiota bacterium]
MKETIKLILVLTIICAVSSALLAAVYSKTKDPISASLERRTANAAAKVMPKGAALPERKVVEGETFFVAQQDGRPVAVAVEGRSPNGYGGEIVLMVGLGVDGTLVNYQKLVASETPGLGTKMESDGFRNPLLGLPLAGDWRVKKDGGKVDAITAATISSRAVLECIRDAIAKYEKAAEPLGVKR